MVLFQIYKVKINLICYPLPGFHIIQTTLYFSFAKSLIKLSGFFSKPEKALSFSLVNKKLWKSLIGGKKGYCESQSLS